MQGVSCWRDGYNVLEIDDLEEIVKCLDEEGKYIVGFCVFGGGICSVSVVMGVL